MSANNKNVSKYDYYASTFAWGKLGSKNFLSEILVYAKEVRKYSNT